MAHNPSYLEIFRNHAKDLSEAAQKNLAYQIVRDASWDDAFVIEMIRCLERKESFYSMNSIEVLEAILHHVWSLQKSEMIRDMLWEILPGQGFLISTYGDHNADRCEKLKTFKNLVGFLWEDPNSSERGVINLLPQESLSAFEVISILLLTHFSGQDEIELASWDRQKRQHRNMSISKSGVPLNFNLDENIISVKPYEWLYENRASGQVSLHKIPTSMMFGFGFFLRELSTRTGGFLEEFLWKNLEHTFENASLFSELFKPHSNLG